MANDPNIESLSYRFMQRPAFAAGVGAVRAATKGALSAIKVPVLWGSPIFVAAFAWLGNEDYKHEKVQLTYAYEPEIAAKQKLPVGTRATIDDLEEVGKDNPVIGETLDRLKKKRNLRITADSTAAIVSTAAAVALTLSLGGIAGIAASVVVGYLAFAVTEKAFNAIGDRILNLNQPAIGEVIRNPDLQKDLPVSQQIQYLTQLRSRGKKLSYEQVLTTYLSANEQLNEQVTTTFGKDFHAMDEREKRKVIEKAGCDLCIVQLTDDINAGLVRPQELAFRVADQVSGVERLQSRQLAAHERFIAQSQEKIHELQTQLAEKTAPMRERMHEGIEATKARMKWKKQEEALPTDETMKAAELPADGFAAKYREQHPQGAITPQEIISQRQKQDDQKVLLA